MESIIKRSSTCAYTNDAQELSSCWDGRPSGHNRHGL